jgi:peptide/nickel transport system substrate-binding protein
LRLVITTVDQDPYPAMAEIIKQNWNELGIEVEIQTVELGRLSQDVLKPRRYDLLLYGELFDQTLDPYAFWDSSQALDPGLNFSIYVNKQVDSLLEANRKEWSREKREERYQQVQRIIADDLPAIFLQTPQYHYIIPSSLHGVREGDLLTSSDRFINVAYWYTKTVPVLKSSVEK